MTRNVRTVALGTVVTLAIAAVPGQAAVRHLITGANVKNNSLTSADIRNRSLHRWDFDRKVQAALKARAHNGLASVTGAANGSTICRCGTTRASAADTCARARCVNWS